MLCLIRLYVNISVALSAVWWDDNAQANVWLVTEENRIRPQQIKIGRTLGDRLEVLEGLPNKSRYVAKIIPGLKIGQSIGDIKLEAEEQQEQKIGDEHGHEE